MPKMSDESFQMMLDHQKKMQKIVDNEEADEFWVLVASGGEHGVVNDVYRVIDADTRVGFLCPVIGTMMYHIDKKIGLCEREWCLPKDLRGVEYHGNQEEVFNDSRGLALYK
jgi:hypothetical protein